VLGVVEDTDEAVGLAGVVVTAALVTLLASVVLSETAYPLVTSDAATAQLVADAAAVQIVAPVYELTRL
jgi:hypothetical protein